VVARTGRTHRQPSWSQVVALHPAAQMLAGAGQAVKPGELGEAAGALSRACDWTMVRQQLITGWHPGEMEARVAVWMDTGMISRWLLDRRPSIDQLVDALGASCPPVVLQRIRRALDGMGLSSHASAGGTSSRCGVSHETPVHPPSAHLCVQEWCSLRHIRAHKAQLASRER
jgi:hypothetical protein